LLIVVTLISGNYKINTSVLGLIWLGVFLFPALLIPTKIQNQAYEHRLYLPLIGLLIWGTPLVRLDDAKYRTKKLYAIGLILLVFAIISFSRIHYFDDPAAFFEEAVKDSPHAGIPKVSLGTRLYDDPAQRSRAMDLFWEAYHLNPDERFLNYFIARYYMEKDSLDKAEYYLRNEIRNTDFAEANFMMSDLMYRKNQKDSSIAYLDKLISAKTEDTRVYNNLLILYLEKQDYASARKIIQTGELRHINLNPEMVKEVGKHL
jgi:tetratricopeptide (TPR) repeat protein